MNTLGLLITMHCVSYSRLLLSLSLLDPKLVLHEFQLCFLLETKHLERLQLRQVENLIE